MGAGLGTTAGAWLEPARLIFEGTDLVDCVTEVDGARTWHMTRRSDGAVDEVPLPTRLLSP